MPQLQNLVLTDREATPVNHTFTPRDIVSNVGAVVESSGVPVGDNRFTISLRQVNNRYKATIQMSVPVVQNQTINGITTPVVVRTAFADLTFTFDAQSTTQERTNLVGMLQSAMATNKALFHDTVVGLQGVY